MPKYSAFRLNPIKPLVTPQNWRSSKVGRRQKKNSKKNYYFEVIDTFSPLKCIYTRKTLSLVKRRNILFTWKWFWSKSSRIEKFSKSAHCPQLNFKKCPLLSKHTHTPNCSYSPNDAIKTSTIFYHFAHLILEV